MSHESQVGPELVVPMYDAPVADAQELELEPMSPRKAPRIPRDLEPCPLWVFALIVVGMVGCLSMVAGWLMYGAGEGISEVARYADAFYVAMIRWIGGLL